MKKMRFAYLFTVLIALFFIQCEKEKTDNNTTSEPSITEWIYENMDAIYFWEDQLPREIDYTKETDPEAYFYKLLYTEEDHWSWISDDYESLSQSLAGTPTSMGYSPSFYKFSDSNNVYIIVEYVYPNSPASEAGLKRGDIILTINNTELNIDNYYDLYTAQNANIELGEVNNNGIVKNGITYNLVARSIQANPVLYTDVLEFGGKKIAYMVYVEFIAGETNEYIQAVDNAIADFNAAGVDELILDLRYNPGGDLIAAGNLASSLAPANIVSEGNILIRQVYNKQIQAFFESDMDTYGENLIYEFPESQENINIDRLYCLTSKGTASSSELVIAGLAPYMDVIQIGEATHGKYTGMWVIPDTKNPPRHNWVMVPIVMKYANANGFTDFKDGIQPDYAIDDDLFNALPFGDTSDPVLNKAIELISGVVTKKTHNPKKPSFDSKKIIPKEIEIRSNLFIENKLIQLNKK